MCRPNSTHRPMPVSDGGSPGTGTAGMGRCGGQREDIGQAPGQAQGGDGGHGKSLRGRGRYGAGTGQDGDGTGQARGDMGRYGAGAA